MYIEFGAIIGEGDLDVIVQVDYVNKEDAADDCAATDYIFNVGQVVLDVGRGYKGPAIYLDDVLSKDVIEQLENSARNILDES